MELQTHGARKYPTSTLLKSSAGLGWSTISAELRSHGVFETPVIVPQHVELCLTIDGNKEGLLIRTVAGRRRQITPTTGTICISPIGIADNAITGTAPIPKELHLYLPAALFRRLSDDFNLPGKPGSSIRYASGAHDGIIEQIGRSILSEMTDETSAGRMFVETASLTLATRLLHKYADSRISAPSPLASHKIDHARLRGVLDYVAMHLADDITVSDLAGVAGLSTFHFARMFTLAVGVSPYRYVSRMRLERAMAEIAEGKSPLSKIAFDARFSSQASFTRAFRRATEMTPGEYRRARRRQTTRLEGRLDTAHPAPLAPIWIERSQSDNPVSTANGVKTMAGAGQTPARVVP
jgi:AraC family transcriptional regulator